MTSIKDHKINHIACHSLASELLQNYLQHLKQENSDMLYKYGNAFESEINKDIFFQLLDSLKVNVAFSNFSFLKLIGLVGFIMRVAFYNNYIINVDLAGINTVLSKSKIADFTSVKVAGNVNSGRAIIVATEIIKQLDINIISKAEYIFCEISSTLDLELSEIDIIVGYISLYTDKKNEIIIGTTTKEQTESFIEVSILVGM